MQLAQSTSHTFRYAAFASLALIFLGGFFMLQPFSFSNSSYATDASVDINVNLSAAIEIWTTDTSNNATSTVNITAPPDETVHTGTIRTHVATNNTTGYTLTIHSASSDSKMTHSSAPTISTTIDPLSSNNVSTTSWTSNSNLNNMWGYDVDSNDSYLPVPNNTTARNVNDSSDPVTDDTTDITFGTKVDLDLPAGTYSDTVVFSAVANSNPDFYMQDFTSTQCNALDEWSYDSETNTVHQGDTITLWDRRDNNSYKVRKLADGNCWMVENLRLSAESLIDNSHSTTLNYTDTDISDNTTFTVPATSNTDWGGNEYVLGPRVAASDVEGHTDYGMYYNWWAATARTTNIINSGDSADDSLCAKNWQLPTGNSTGQWYAMFSAYQNAYGWININGVGNDMGAINVTNNFANDTIGPNLQFSGYWSYSSTAPLGQSLAGYWWSSTVRNEANSRYAFISTSGVVYGGTDNLSKRRGFSVRCLLNAN